MIIPVRCFTCLKPIANNWDKYSEITENNTTKRKEALDQLGYDRTCCRRMFMTHVEIIDNLLMYK